jgi:uroporphyrinogen decarboxylase
VAAATDGPLIVAPRIYLDHSIPNLARMVAAADKAGLPLVFHPHGRFTDSKFQLLVDSAVATGIAGFQFPENCDLGIAKTKLGKQIEMLGGIDIPTLLVPGPPSSIVEEVRRCLIQAAAGGGYIFMPSCSLHRGDPLDHIEVMVKAVRQYGGSVSGSRCKRRNTP